MSSHADDEHAIEAAGIFTARSPIHPLSLAALGDTMSD
jgi:hypothetical protein